MRPYMPRRSNGNLRSGSIFVSLCNNIPAGKAKQKLAVAVREECMRTAKIGPDLTLVRWSQAAFFLNKFELNQRDVDELYRCNKVNEV